MLSSSPTIASPAADPLTDAPVPTADTNVHDSPQLPEVIVSAAEEPSAPLIANGPPARDRSSISHSIPSDSKALNSAWPIKLIIGLLAAPQLYNSIAEIVDGINKSGPTLQLFPFPGNPEGLAFLPNDERLQLGVILGVIGYTIEFELPALQHGIERVLDSFQFNPCSLRLPPQWKALWREQGLPENKLKWIVGACLLFSFLSTVNEILNSLSMGDDDSEEDSAKKEHYAAALLEKLTSQNEISQIAAIIGNLVFFLGEALKLPQTAVDFYTKQREPYPCSYEIITLPFRLASSTGAALFALATAKNVIGFNSSITPFVWFAFLNSWKGVTSFAYDGEYFLEISNKIFNIIGERRRPSFRDSFLALIATLSGGISAFIQQRLTESYLEDLEASEFIKTYLLPPMIMLYAWQMWVTYSGSTYSFLDKVFTWIGTCCCSNCTRAQSMGPPGEAQDNAEPYRPLPKDEKTSGSKPASSSDPAPTTSRSVTTEEPSVTVHFVRWLGEKGSQVANSIRGWCGRRPEKSKEAETELAALPSPTQCPAAKPISASTAAASITSIASAKTQAVTIRSSLRKSSTTTVVSDLSKKTSQQLKQMPTVVLTRNQQKLLAKEIKQWLDSKPVQELQKRISQMDPQTFRSLYESGLTHFVTERHKASRLSCGSAPLVTSSLRSIRV